MCISSFSCKFKQMGKILEIVGQFTGFKNILLEVIDNVFLFQ